MKMKLTSVITFSVLLLSACTSKPVPIAGSGALDTNYTGYGVQENQVQTTTTIQKDNKRINTTQCQDSDDWYIDGYRVGKSFANQKQKMFQSRLNQCNYSTKSIPTYFVEEWERGFQKGRS